MFDIFSSVMFDGNITPSLESPFFKDLNDACCISGVQIQPAKIKFKSTTSKSKMSLRGPERVLTRRIVNRYSIWGGWVKIWE